MNERAANQHRGRAGPSGSGVHVRQGATTSRNHVVAEDSANRPAAAAGRSSGMSMADSASSRRAGTRAGGSAQGSERLAVVARGRGSRARRVAVAFPDQVGLAADDRIAAADLAAGDGFEQETVAPRVGRFIISDTAGVEVGGEPGKDQLVPARGPARLEPGRNPTAPPSLELRVDGVDFMGLVQPDADLGLHRLATRPRRCPGRWIAPTVWATICVMACVVGSSRGGRPG